MMSTLKRNHLLLMLILLILLQASALTGQDLHRYEFESRHMGTTFQIILFAENDSIADLASESAFSRIEEINDILSDYMPDSELSRLSKRSGSGEQVTVSKPLFDFLERSVEISKETDGWFDITIGPYTHIWRGLNRMSEPTLPDVEELANARSRVGFDMLSLDAANQTASLEKEGMRLDPGGIGKGFASDTALLSLREAGITRALINAGGDISAGDPPPGRDGWTIAVPVRFDADSTLHEELIISNRAVNTSGSLYQSVDIDDVTYSHIINPRTGLGHTEQVQVTAISANGAVADAFATALSVMPVSKAQHVVENRPDLEAVIYWLDENGQSVRWASKEFELLSKP